MSDLDGKADTDVRREMQVAAYKADLAKAQKVEDIAQFYLKAGTDPAYVAHRYGLDVERCRRYVAALTKQKEAQREREHAMRGNQEAPQSWSFDHGIGGAEQVRVDETRCADMGPEETGDAYRQAHG